MIQQVIKTLLTDVNSREILFSGLTPVDSTLLTFTDGTSFIPTATQTAIDIEKSDDGTIKLLTYREAGEAIKLAPKRVRKLINRRWQWINTYQPVTENSEAGFFIDTFDENGNPTQETIKLNAADPATYEAEKLFGLDLNGDNVQGRNVQKFDRDAFITQKIYISQQ